MRSRILFLPEFEKLSDFQDMLARTAFHLGHVDLEALTFIVSDDLREDAEHALQNFHVPADFDSDIEATFSLVVDAVHIVDSKSPNVARLGHVSDIVVVWDSKGFAQSDWLTEGATYASRHDLRR